MPDFPSETPAETVAPSRGEKTWMTVCIKYLCLHGMVGSDAIAKWRLVSTGWSRAADAAKFAAVRIWQLYNVDAVSTMTQRIPIQPQLRIILLTLSGLCVMDVCRVSMDDARASGKPDGSAHMNEELNSAWGLLWSTICNDVCRVLLAAGMENAVYDPATFEPPWDRFTPSPTLDLAHDRPLEGASP
jgi:hypothetical protein